MSEEPGGYLGTQGGSLSVTTMASVIGGGWEKWRERREIILVAQVDGYCDFDMR